jgi:bifunctional non-homologous end joining protein LigD
MRASFYAGQARSDHHIVAMFPKISPIIPVRRRDLFESAEWVYELKHDGFRALAYIAEGHCRLISRRGNVMKRFNDLSGSIAKELKVTDAILDGEIVALDGDGLPAFYDLMKRRCQAVYYAFDIYLAERPRSAGLVAT